MEPTSPSEDAEGQAIVRVLATVLERLVQANSSIEVEATAPPQEQTHFHAQRAPAIGILAYLERYVCLYIILVYIAVRCYVRFICSLQSSFSLLTSHFYPTHIPLNFNQHNTSKAYTNMHPVPRNVSS